MKRVIPYGTFALQLFLFFFLSPVQEAGAKILYVGPNETYDNIKWALSQASAGDTIMVRDGVYVEEIKVRIPVVLMAENRHQAVIGDGSDSRAMISIRQGIVDGAVIDGFKFAPGEYGSIWVGDMDAENAPSNCIIKNNHIEGRNKGIVVSPTAMNTTLSGNIISGCASNGILVQGHGNTLLSGNTLEDCEYWGIFCAEVEIVDPKGSFQLKGQENPGPITLKNNVIKNNKEGGIGVERPDVTMLRNLVEGNKIGIGTNSGKSGIVVRDSNQVINNLETGIMIENGTQASIVGNTINGNGKEGIKTYGFATVSKNHIEGNTSSGIHTQSGSAQITSNEIVSNEIHGIEISAGIENSEITGNFINNNKHNGVVTSSAVRIGGNTIEGNEEHGILIGFGTDSVDIVDQNIITGNQVFGILIEPEASASIMDNEISSNFIHGIEIREDAGIVKIFRNSIHDNMEMGVVSFSSGTMKENHIKNNGLHGISTWGIASDVTISDNLIESNWDGVNESEISCGIWIEGSARVEGNTIQNHDKRGILVTETAQEIEITTQNQISGNRIGVDLSGSALLKNNTVSDNVKRGIVVRSSAGEVSLIRNRIENNGSGVSVLSGASNILISSNGISNNEVGIFLAGEAKLRSNTIQYNSNYGIKIRNAGIDLGNELEADSGLNAFLDNGEWNIINETSEEIPAFCNYWGLTSAAEIDSTIMDNDEDSLMGPVIFEPFLSEQTQELNLGISKSEISPGTGLLFIYPNPVHQGATIQFTMDTDGKASLDIYNISGNLVRSLLAGQHCLPGNHSIPWDGSSGGGRMVPDGVYVVILKTDQRIYSKKIMVVR